MTSFSTVLLHELQFKWFRFVFFLKIFLSFCHFFNSDYITFNDLTTNSFMDIVQFLNTPRLSQFIIFQFHMPHSTWTVFDEECIFRRKHEYDWTIWTSPFAIESIEKSKYVCFYNFLDQWCVCHQYLFKPCQDEKLI